MARAVKKNDAMCPKHIFPESVTFSMFTTEEIKKLSVLKIVSPLSFDALGHPLPTGLYDKTLGPLSEKSEPCGTCFMNIYACPGHFGHIELPLPVINPLFDKTIVTLLKMSCLTCFCTQIPGHVKHSLGVQMKLLDKGLNTEAVEIADHISQLISQYESMENIPEEEFGIIKKYELLAEKATGCLSINKNTEGLKNQVISLWLRGMKARKRCMHCKKHLKKVQKIKDSYFIVEKKISESTGLTESGTKPMNREEIRRCLRSIWSNEQELILQLVPMLSDVSCDPPTDVFFFEVIPVPPPNVRPVNFVNGRITESAQSNLYKSILHDAALLRTVIHVLKNRGDSSVLQDTAKNIYTLAKGSSAIEKVHNAWDSLQYNVNGVLDRDGPYAQGEMGLKQIIEKKAGIIRMHMMGKRVNFASRSVITPDPNLNIDEIGIPEEFARTLTYPVPVTMWNVEELRKRIMNGPNVYPGAVLVEFEDGSVNRINPNNPTHQESLLKRLLTPDDGNEGFRGVKMVHRHLQNGDVLLLNRQPTLHKPSIMAHTARILKGERTLRLHYANCKAYNADFDGDEMNAHFPQNEVARSEAYNLANVANQYLVPKDGTPLLGLIQDHMIAGVKLSVRGRFFTKYDYQQLVFLALGHKQSKITTLPPAIIKPEELWSGKQIISTVILNTIPQNAKPINLTSTAKIESKSWQGVPPRQWDCPFRKDDDMSEAEVVIRQGELLVGVLDKMHYGATPYGLIHCIYELYGGTPAIRLLSSFAKLFTGFLQMEGFTLGVRDILVTKDSDKKRRKITKKSRKIGKNLIEKVVAAPENSPMQEILEKLEFSFASNPNFRNIIDQQYSNALKTFTNDINRVCLSEGLISKFPENNLQLMVQSGAKGSTVNTLQISCLLGQIELEGKRPPVMISGKSLPCFPNFEFSPRAGGFIDGRFMTGIKCQEFFFHCMAGREGLIDTAVKTSRSGYLQRCLIKGLEGVTIGYDLTVRDSDNTVIQFYYGEDGMDVCKSQFLNKKQMQFLADNAKAIVDKDTIEQLKSVDRYDESVAYYNKLKTWKDTFGDPAIKQTQSAFTVFSGIVGKKTDIKSAHKLSEDCGRTRKTKYITKLWSDIDQELKENCMAKCAHAPDPVASVYQPDCFFGSMNERLETLMEDEIKSFAKKKQKRQFEEMLKLKAMRCICPPGEPVGLLAAQSIGEPSTQMTLNTFHFAGRGEMNVTLGIPRLREILMTASKTLKTPRMEIPFLEVPDLEAKAGKLIKILTRVVVADVLEKVDVTSTLDIKAIRQRKYVLRFQFLPYDLYKADYAVKPRKILKHMSKRFFGQMFSTVKKYLKLNADMVFSKDEQKEKPRKKRDDDDDEDDVNIDEKTPKTTGLDGDSSDEEVEDPEDAKTNFKYNQVHDGQEPEPEETPQDNFSDYENEEGAADTAEQEDQVKESVIDSHSFAQDYTYDTEEHLWCELTFALPLNYKRVDMVEILRDVASKSVLWETPNIKRAIIDTTKNSKLTLITDGINMIEIFKYSSILDLNKLYSNDIHKIAETYGIEAAFRVIVKEIQDVFNVYHITVDPRHLKLVADYMTSSGIFEPFNRKGMECSASPLQQMTFESSLTFLKQAVLRAKRDQLKNPSSCLMVGKNCGTGTGSFAIMHQLFAK